MENHVRYLETQLVEKLKENIYISLEELNADIQKIVATLNSGSFKTRITQEVIYESDRMLDTHAIELLQKCEWIVEPKNLLITGSAEAGKTYIANALCITALQQLRTVKYIRANVLLLESEKSCQLGHAYDYTNQMAAYDLLVIDGFRLM